MKPCTTEARRDNKPSTISKKNFAATDFMKLTENISKHMQQNNTIVATISISKPKVTTYIATNITNQSTEAKRKITNRN
jgi:hypothetical protein